MTKSKKGSVNKTDSTKKSAAEQKVVTIEKLKEIKPASVTIDRLASVIESLPA